MLHKEIPFLRAGIPLCAGIISGLWFHPDQVFYFAAITLTSLLFLVSLAFNRYFINSFYGSVLSFSLFIYGLFIYNADLKIITKLESTNAIFRGRVLDFPEEKEKSSRITVALEEIIFQGSPHPVGGSILLYHKKDKRTCSLLPGDVLFFKCTPVQITSRGNPYEFDYRFYMHCQGFGYYAFTDSSDILLHKKPVHRSFSSKALIIREKIIDMFRQRGIEGERLALVAAITLGQKNMLDPEQKQFFIKAGVMHIMAVSGLHAVILSLFVFKVLFFLKGRLNFLRIIIALIILWLFAFVTGMTPSVMRAALMFTFIQAGNLLKRPVNPVNSILASAFALIILRPSVIFDAGFQLSYAAVIYIVVFYNDLYMKLRFRHRIPDLIWQSVAVTIIAQAGTLPLTIMLFNRFPVWFIISNVIIVPVSSLVIITGCLMPVFYPAKFISQPLAWILDKLTGLTEFLTEKAASLPMATIDNIGITRIECIFMIIALFTLIMFLLRKKSMPVAVPLICILLFTGYGTIKDIKTRRTSEVIVYNPVQSNVTGIRSGRRLNVFSDTTGDIAEVNRHTSAMNLKMRLYDISGKTVKIKAGNRNILITSMVDYEILKNTLPDILIINGRIATGRNLAPVHKLQAVIIASSITSGNRTFNAFGSLNADSVHFVRKRGSYRLTL